MTATTRRLYAALAIYTLVCAALTILASATLVP